MPSPIRGLRTVTLFIVLNAGALSTAITEDAVERPSLDEIRLIEAQIKMPRGAASIGEYVRYYYTISTEKPRTVGGMYVERRDLEYLAPSATPAEEVVVVDSDADVPAPWDAGCSVVTVTYAPRNTPSVNAWCSPELTVESPSPAGRFIEFIALTSVLGILLAGFVWLSRRLIARRAGRSRDDAA